MQIEKPYTSSFASQILGASSEILGNASASHFTSGVVWNLLFFSNAWMNNFSILNFVWFDERRIRSSFWGHHTQATRNVIVTYVVNLNSKTFSISCYQDIDRHYLFAFYLEIEHDLIFFPTCELQSINWHEKQSPPTEISTNSVVGVKVNILWAWYFKSGSILKKMC